jgi:hypothetical protein
MIVAKAIVTISGVGMAGVVNRRLIMGTKRRRKTLRIKPT